jgi:hypothetical protein
MEDPNNTAWGRTGFLTILAAGNAAFWCILLLVIGGSITNWTEFLKYGTWATIYVLISLVMLKVFAGLNHEINHKTGTFGKIAMILITCCAIYFTVVWFIEIFTENNKDVFMWLWFGDMVQFTGMAILEIAIFFALFSGGDGLA